MLPVSPGGMVSLFGSAIGPLQPAGTRLDANGLIATELAAVRVLFNGTPAPLLYVSQSQINAIVPYSVEAFDSVTVEIQKEGQIVGSITLPVVNAVPRIFTNTGTGTGQAAAVNADGRLNSAANPVRAGTALSIYATGGGGESVVPVDGRLAHDASQLLRLPTTVTIGNQNARVLYAGAAPDAAGLLQVNVIVPAQSERGNSVPVVVRVGGAPSQAGVTIAVQ